MTSAESGGVRPTKRCLTDLGLKFPPVNVSLTAVDHPLIEKAQQLPAEASAGGAERIRSLNDRVWFKVKVTTYRGAATKLDPAGGRHVDLLTAAGAWWWVCAAGERKSDSRSDFYRSIESEAVRAGSGSGSVSTVHLLPQDIDFKRLDAEVALLADRAIRDLTRRLIYVSLTSGKVVSAEFSNYVLKACVRAKEEEAYLAIAAEGFINPEILAIVLDAVPDIPHTDWQVEPGGAMGVEVAYGQIVFSTVIPPATQTRIIELFAETDE